MISAILIGLTILFIAANLYYFFTSKSYNKSYFDPAMFYKLFLVMLGVTFGFTLLYYFLSFNEVILRINDPKGEVVEPTFSDLLYFSGVTILAVGYGDLVPVGSARLFSLLQAGLGLLLPAAYFMKALSGESKEESNE
ncbi:ion channel [Alteribacter natronophilus]|uniref:ion channel n=1 Tax=Alteribacter natronophilus TaxID=2583810 RepID=UPI00110E0C83|nr:ion channel [Alteribacter natronophilus]TMW70913.1 two pore domain potassium channel family protein [Alteribacter natronophilus]